MASMLRTALLSIMLMATLPLTIAVAYSTIGDGPWTTGDHDYQQWANSKSFQVGDSISMYRAGSKYLGAQVFNINLHISLFSIFDVWCMFSYTPTHHNGLQVRREAFDSCDKAKPLRVFTSGADIIDLNDTDKHEGMHIKMTRHRRETTGAPPPLLRAPLRRFGYSADQQPLPSAPLPRTSLLPCRGPCFVSALLPAQLLPLLPPPLLPPLLLSCYPSFRRFNSDGPHAQRLALSAHSALPPVWGLRSASVEWMPQQFKGTHSAVRVVGLDMVHPHHLNQIQSKVAGDEDKGVVGGLHGRVPFDEGASRGDGLPPRSVHQQELGLGHWLEEKGQKFGSVQARHAAPVP
ncbi:hypothetical protein Scep_030395 [Stephania cephalantha]|uniref:Phytocyanin domain-containing protein n=1 Tax=Stephania cephalantha TaxID=152367 RepID=A0AAP0HEB2_9MAGN